MYERYELRDRVRMIERHARSDASTPVMTDDRERSEAVAAHEFDLVERQAALRVAGVVSRTLWLVAVAVAAQIGSNHREVRGERGRDLVPDRVRLRMAMQEQERRAASALDCMDANTVDVHRRICETFEHDCLPTVLAV